MIIFIFLLHSDKSTIKIPKFWFLLASYIVQSIYWISSATGKLWRWLDMSRFHAHCITYILYPSMIYYYLRLWISYSSLWHILLSCQSVPVALDQIRTCCGKWWWSIKTDFLSLTRARGQCCSHFYSFQRGIRSSLQASTAFTRLSKSTLIFIERHLRSYARLLTAALMRLPQSSRWCEGCRSYSTTKKSYL